VRGGGKGIGGKVPREKARWVKGGKGETGKRVSVSGEGAVEIEKEGCERGERRRHGKAGRGEGGEE